MKGISIPDGNDERRLRLSSKQMAVVNHRQENQSSKLLSVVGD
jgi:folate-dependent tRNA-U54 methylase TrmFO/GidA